MLETDKGGHVNRTLGTARGRSLGMRGALVATVLCALFVVLASTTGRADAKIINPYVYSGTTFNGSSATAGAFVTPAYMAINQATGNVYVLDLGHGGTLSQFDAAGNAVPFTDPALGGASSITLGTLTQTSAYANPGTDIAIDNSGGPSQGNIYVLKPTSEVLGFDSTGHPLPAPNWPMCGASCAKYSYWTHAVMGLGTGPDGTIWASTFSPERHEGGFDPTGFLTSANTLTPFDASGIPSTTKAKINLFKYQTPLGGDTESAKLEGGSIAFTPRRLDFDSQGNIYVFAQPLVANSTSPGESVMKLDPEGHLLNKQVSTLPTPAASTRPDLAVDRTTGRVFVSLGNTVNVYDSAGTQLDTLAKGGLEGGSAPGVAVNEATGKVYVANQTPPSVSVFQPGEPMVVPDVTTDPPTAVTPTSATMNGTINPNNGGAITSCQFKWGTSAALTNAPIPCSGALPENGNTPVQVSAPLTGLTKSKTNRYHYRLVVSNQPAAAQPQSGVDRVLGVAELPVLTNLAIDDVNSDTAQVKFRLDPKGGITTFHIEVGTTESYGDTVWGGLSFSYGGEPAAQDVSAQLDELAPDTIYHYRVIAENEAGVLTGPDRTFKTFLFVPSLNDPCPNALSRQQTGAALLLDCRAYELVSAADQGGYNVESDLNSGQTPFGGYPRAEGKVLYSVHSGGIPNTGSPTNRGPDPYIASRGDDSWSTKYVGIASDGTPSALPFSSTLAGADAGLTAFAFAGPEICAPCFADGSTNIPLRLPDGNLVKGITGSEDPGPADPAGQIGKYFSDDGSHFVFGTTSKLEPAGNSGTVSIYDRNLSAGGTQVVSTMPDGSTMTGSGIAELDISSDGSRILIGKLVSTDAAGNQYWHLYMHIGNSPNSIDLAPTTSTGVIYDGMNADGTKVFFTSADKLDGVETDISADLYRADVGISSSTLSRVSTGIEGTGDVDTCDPMANTDGNNWNTVGGASANSCGIVAIAAGGGVAAENGTVFFFSPEKLDGSANGTLNQPNLYVVEPGGSPHYIITLEPNNAAVRHAVADSEKRNTADFQVNPSGLDAAFTTTLPQNGYENLGFSQVINYDSTTKAVDCISCPRSNAPSTGNATLASNGLSVTDDGRVFFNSADRLVLRDSNRRQDAYEWTPENDGTVELISTGLSAQNSSLLSASADGKDVFFFTRQKLVSQDLNGPNVKIYDARENGGFFVVPPLSACKASDECHGPGTVAAGPAPIRSITGTESESSSRKPCKKGFVKKHGRCVRKKSRKRHSTRRNG